MDEKQQVAIPTDEMEMRAFKAPTPDTSAELAKLADDLVNRQHEYGTCVYAMSILAEAAFNFVARRLGVTGFQASCADMDILRRTRGWKGPAMILDGENALYPQYDLRGRVDEWLTSEPFRQWCADEARKLIAERNGVGPHPNVAAHWDRLAASMPPKAGCPMPPDPRWTPCPSCGRRPSERVSVYDTRPKGIDVKGCPDPLHDMADASPALYSALKEIERHHAALNDKRGRAQSSSYTLNIARAALQLAQPAGRKA